MSLGGLVIGFYKGWSLALAMLAIGPIMFCGVAIFGGIMQKRSLEGMKAYG